jgi:hypothetical protein
MKSFIRQRLRESLEYNHVIGSANNDTYAIGEHWAIQDEELALELDRIAKNSTTVDQVQMELKAIEDRYSEKYAEFPGDSYGVIDVISRVIPREIEDIYKEMHPRVYEQKLNEIGTNINDIRSELKTLPDTLTLYRVVFVDNPNDINQNQPGDHYVLNKRDLERSHYKQTHVGHGNPYLITVKAPKSMVDFETTIDNRIKYPHEKEITLKNKGAGAKIINVSEFQPSDDIDDIIGSPEDFEF